MKIWQHSTTHPEGKFLVVRRDGTLPAWPHFVLGARDPAAPCALYAYAACAETLGMDQEYVTSIRALAGEFTDYRKASGNGDPDAQPHRVDDALIIEAMRRKGSSIQLLSVLTPSGGIITR